MSEEPLKDSNVRSTIEAVTGLVKAVPIYDDALQPAAKQVGKSLETLTKTINIALAPIKVLVWGYEQIESWVTSRVAEKLKNVPIENITTPPPNVAGPVIEALRYAGFDDNLRELYANLLVASMDKETVGKAHPGYVEILKNMSPDEALMMRAYQAQSALPAINVRGLAGDGTYILYRRYHNHLARLATLNYPDLIPSYIDNLTRLGLLEVAPVELSDRLSYVPLEIDPDIEPDLAFIVDQGKEVRFDRLVIRLTVFGAHFIQNVVISRDS